MSVETDRTAIWPTIWPGVSANALVLASSAAAFLVHLSAGGNYGYFVDELYYLACSHHLA